MRLEEHKVSEDDNRLARQLRNSAPPLERKLWRLLNQTAKAEGMHFRRQFPVHPYVVDFACLKARLVIEIDGYSHDVGHFKDPKREAFLRKEGFKILRFSNEQVKTNVKGFVMTIIVNTKKLLSKLDLNRQAELPPTLTLPARGRGHHRAN